MDLILVKGIILQGIIWLIGIILQKFFYRYNLDKKKLTLVLWINILSTNKIKVYRCKLV
jgi:hypothetical protein